MAYHGDLWNKPLCMSSSLPHSYAPHGNKRPVKENIERSYKKHKARNPSKLTQLPFEIITSIFILSSNPELPLVCTALFQQLYRSPDDIKLEWLLFRHDNNITQALEAGLRFRFFSLSLLSKFDLRHGSEIRLTNKTIPPYMFASPDYHDLVTTLLERGASPHKPQGYPIIKSAQIGNLQMVKTLVAHGADASARGNMALRACAARANMEILLYFLDDLQIKPDSDTLNVCAQKELWHIVKILVDHGAVPDISTINSA